MRTKFVAVMLGLSGLGSLVARDACAQEDKAAKAVEAAQPAGQAGLEFAQEQVQMRRQALGVPMMRMRPAMAARTVSGLPFDLGNLVLAKFDDGPNGAQLVAMLNRTRTERKMVPVTAIRQEVRTRKVQVVGGDGKPKEIDQQYTVAVPITQEVEREVEVPVGKKPTAIPFDGLRIYRLDGSKVTVAEAKTLLEKTTPVFLLKGYTGDIKPVEGVVLQAINPNCLIVVTEPAPEQQAPMPVPAAR